MSTIKFTDDEIELAVEAVEKSMITGNPREIALAVLAAIDPAIERIEKDILRLEAGFF